MAPNGDVPPGTYSLAIIPSKRAFCLGAAAILGSLTAALIAYLLISKGGWEAYVLKLADTLIQGSVAGVGFAILKGIIETIQIRPK